MKTLKYAAISMLCIAGAALAAYMFYILCLIYAAIKAVGI